MMTKVTAANFDSEVLQADVPVLVDFWAEWCPPCQMLSPTIEQLAGEADGRYKVGKVNADEEPGLAARFQIGGLPTVLVFRRGEVVASLIGLQPRARLLEALQRAS